MKSYFPQLLKEGKLSAKTAINFFDTYVNSDSNANLNRELLIKCVEQQPLIYEKTDPIFKNKSIELILAYIQSSQMHERPYELHIPYDLRQEAKEVGVEVGSYVINKYLTNKLTELHKSKPKKI